MKAVILAGGLPSTLANDAEKIPKPMAEIGGYPILWHIMKLYSYYGFHDFIICTGYKGNMIKEYFMDYYIYQSDITVNLQNNQIEIHKKQTEDWNVTILDTGINTSITNRIHRVKNYLDDDDFLLSYGDCISDINLKSMKEYYMQTGKIGTVAVARPAGRNAILPIDESGMFQKDGIQQQTAAWVNACTMIFTKKVFQYLPENDSYLERGLFTNLQGIQELTAFRHEGFWLPMETKRDHSTLERMWGAKQAPWKKW